MSGRSRGRNRDCPTATFRFPEKPHTEDSKDLTKSQSAWTVGWLFLRWLSECLRGWAGET
jgi:hypothetical protein